MAKKKNPPVVREDIQGDLQIEASEFVKAIGEKTFDIWCALIWRRDFEGVTYVRNITLEKKKNLSKRQIIRILQKLKSVGLVETLEKSKIKHKRVVYGDYRSSELKLPKTAWEKVQGLPQHGGDRTGAGRPSKHIETKGKQESEINQDVTQKINQDVTSKIQDVTQKNQDGTPPILILKNNIKNDYIFSTRKDMEPGSPAHSYCFTHMSTGTGLPPYPSTALLKTPRLPAPPKLPSDGDPESGAAMIAAAYRGAVESRTGQTCWAFSRGRISRSKYFKALCAAGELFVEHDISPASWLAFSADIWLQHFAKGKVTAPPVNWAISTKRIAQHHGWFNREALNYSGGRLLLTDQHKDLLRRYDGLKRSMFQCLNPDEIHTLIDEWFPDGWEKMYEIVKQEGREEQKRIERVVKRGEFIW